MGKNVAIDRLRGISVLVVICMHTQFYFPNPLTFLGKSLWNGYYGVVAFFCTSGFLITTNILKRYGRVAQTDLYAFYVMRFGRIVPPLVLLFVVIAWLGTTSVEAFHFVAPDSLRDTLLNVIKLRYNHYFQRVDHGMLVCAVLWSLSIEEVFYLVYPLAAKLVRHTALLVLGLVVIVGAGIWHRRGGLFTNYDYFGCFDEIALGALAALVARRLGHAMGQPVAWAVMLVGITLVGSIYALIFVDDHHNLGPSLISAGTALILFASQCAPFVKTRPSPYDPLAYLGRLSYELYLFHMTVYALLCSVTVARYPILVFAIAMLCVVFVSDLIARFYAEPLNRWLRAVLLPARKSPVHAAAPDPHPAV